MAIPGAPRSVRGSLYGLGVLGIVALLTGFVANARLDVDEGQHLHMAWRVGQGQVPFADFWEHHMPLLAYLLAPLTWWFADSPAIYFAGRVVMAGVLLGSLALVYALARRLGADVAVAAVLLLVVQYRFVQFGTQVRPDGPALLAWLATVLALVAWRERGGAWLWAAGIGLGVAATLTPKAVYAALGAAGVVIAACASSPRALAQTGRALVQLGAGSALPLAALLAWLAISGGTRALHAFVEQIIVANLRFPDFTRQPPLDNDGAAFTALCVIGIAVALWRHGLPVLRHPVHGPLLVPMLVVTAILLSPTTPAVNRYAWLPVLAGGAVYAGLGFVALVEHLRARGRKVAAAAVVVAVVAACVEPAALTADAAFRNRTDLGRMRLALAYACPGEAVIDAVPWYVFRPSAFRYLFLDWGLVTWLHRGVIAPQVLVDDLRAARAPVGFIDSRLKRIGEPVLGFLGKHYVAVDVPGGPEGLLLAGARLTLPQAAGETEVSLLVPGHYRLSQSPGLHVAIDGEVARSGLVALRAGPHRISWTGGLGGIQLVIAPCAERRS